MTVSVLCADLRQAEGGLKLRDRERLRIDVQANFPYEHPRVYTTHRRFAGFPHVQWGTYLCLYVAPQTEWNPADGMFGFLARLESWLRNAALNQLDPVGGPLHPPIAYVSSNTPMVVVRANAPDSGNVHWYGLAELKQVHERRLDLVGWHELSAETSAFVGAAVLLASPMPFEFPDKVGDLLSSLEERGVPRPELLLTIGNAIVRNGQEQPLYFVLGSPMRGIRGGEMRQHLTVWRIDVDSAKLLDLQRKTLRLVQDAVDLIVGAEQVSEALLTHFTDSATLHGEVGDLVTRWAKDATVKWCRVRESREEVTVRRDTSSPMAAVRERSVAVWGCGALGSHIAEALVRGGVKRLLLRDSGTVAPGILVRQAFDDQDIGKCKAIATAERLQRLGFDCDIQANGDDVLRDPLGAGAFDDVDLIVDTTASRAVHYRMEELWLRSGTPKPSICSLMIDASASFGIVAFADQRHTGCAADVLREAKCEMCRRDDLIAFREAFYPDEPPIPFQPEPGCSDATFVGSEADISALSALMLNVVCEELANTAKESGAAWLLSFGRGCAARPQKVRLGIAADRVFVDPGSGFHVRVRDAVWKEMLGWARECQRTRGRDVETGGLLFGECDECLQIVWVSEVVGPPPDSTHAAELFVCGTAGTVAVAEYKARCSLGSVRYIGTWHTHPVSEPIPSGIDLQAMDRLLDESTERLLLLILGTALTQPRVTTCVFERSEFQRFRSQGRFERAVQVFDTVASESQDTRNRRIGVALSGGGSRAMAFHLGCLRALNDRRILPQVDVLSTVSGGSVIGAMYAYSSDTFEEFDARVCEVLRSGFVGTIARETFTTPLAAKIAATFLASTIPAACVFALRTIVEAAERQVRRRKSSGAWARGLQPPFRRWASRTDAFVQGLSRELFGNAKVTDKRRNDVNVVINACELRTGTAFRFGNRESGTWQLGTLEENAAEVALAVAASAAYPLLLPALDRRLNFLGRQGGRRRERVILTDGGVYENLGVLSMAPGRTVDFSTNVYHPEYIICCDAGRGALDDSVLPFGWGGRAARSFEAVHRQVQHGLQAQMHLWRSSGAIRGFVYSYLGQQDRSLPYIPADLVPRSEVAHYPTDFSPMPVADLERLAARGYRLTRLLLTHYCPEL